MIVMPGKNYNRRGRGWSGARRRRRNVNQMTYPVAVFPMTVNWNATETGYHELDPSSVTNKDSVYRASSTVVEVACAVPQAFQIVLYSASQIEMETATFTVGPTPRRFNVRAPKHLDYSSKSVWRYILSGAGRVTGIATFTIKSSLDTLTSKEDLGDPGPSSGPSSDVVFVS